MNYQAETLTKALKAFGPKGRFWGNGGPPPICCVTTVFVRIDKKFYDDTQMEPFLRVLGFKTLHHAWAWNDNPRRKFADVKARFENAIAKAQEKP